MTDENTKLQEMVNDPLVDRTWKDRCERNRNRVISNKNNNFKKKIAQLNSELLNLLQLFKK